ncbi:hypothetical protein T492DRAFT_1146636 [Pavlovales sp. CCMP2436]|nr:hypothetical protein T492DRAFT_1146636 [Pavlovales sp. CCMP2436]
MSSRPTQVTTRKTLSAGMQQVEAYIYVKEDASDELVRCGFVRIGRVLSAARRGVPFCVDQAAELAAKGLNEDPHRAEGGDWLLGIAYQPLLIRALTFLARAPVALVASSIVVPGTTPSALNTDGKSFVGYDVGRCRGALTLWMALDDMAELTLGKPAGRKIDLREGDGLVVDARLSANVSGSAPFRALVLRYVPLEHARAHAATLGPVRTLREWCTPEAARAGAVAMEWPYDFESFPLPWHLASANTLRLSLYTVALAVARADETEEDVLAALEEQRRQQAELERAVMVDAIPAEIRAHGKRGRLQGALFSKGPILELDLSGRLQLRNEDGTVVRADAQGLFSPLEPPSPAHSCVACGKPGTQRCAGCGEVCYCSRPYQLADWKGHKKSCRKKTVFAAGRLTSPTITAAGVKYRQSAALRVYFISGIHVLLKHINQNTNCKTYYY